MKINLFAMGLVFALSSCGRAVAARARRNSRGYAFASFSISTRSRPARFAA